MRLLITVLLFFGFMAGHLYAEEQTVLMNDTDKLSYSMGFDIGSKLLQESIEINPDILSKGVQDGFRGTEPLMTKEEMQKAITEFRKDMIAKQKAQQKLLSEKNKNEGEAFLTENKAKEGVVTLPSGLQYKVIKEGTGRTPTVDDTVSTHYRGTLVDGTEFDSSYKRGTPATFPVKGVIAGWTEALQLMKEGDQWKLFLPPQLAYGERGVGKMIGPNATLIFDIELISVLEKK